MPTKSVLVITVEYIHDEVHSTRSHRAALLEFAQHERLQLPYFGLKLLKIGVVVETTHSMSSNREISTAVYSLD